MPICRLDPLTIDRIAAGEVIERPAAAIKELVENALDAGAKSIEVTIEAGGRRLIRVVDDGHGLDEADLALAVERHATSKIPDGDLMQIATFGFRGEALPSIASVSRLEIRTRNAGAPHGLRLLVEDGIKSAIEPCACASGARVEARDLFAATPARLKFLKSDRAEALGRGRRGQAARDGGAAGPLLVHDRPGLGLRLASLRTGRSGLRGAAPPGFGRRLRLELGRARREPRGAAAHRPHRPADLQPAERVPAVPVRQRAGGARQDARRRAARRLSRFPAPGPACGRGFVRRMRSGAKSTSTSIRPRRKCASATPRPSAASSSATIKQRLGEARHRASTTGGTATILAMRPPQPYRGASYSPRWDWRALARGAATGRARAGELRRSRALRAGAGGRGQRARPRGSAWRGAGAIARELHHRPDQGRRGHCRPARGA